VRGYGVAHLRVLVVRDIKLLTHLLDDLADGGIVHVRNLWEQVMFYLKVQAAYEPANDFIMGSEVGGGFNLVNGPLVFQLIRDFVGHGEGGVLYSVRQLEH
jgi:hypothetical protein